MYVTIKPYLMGTGIIVGAWLLTVAVFSTMNWAGLLDHDNVWIAEVLGFAVLVMVVQVFRRLNLAFRHCLPVVIPVLAAMALVFMDP